MSDAPGRPSARGAGIAGDDYQHLFTWLQALKLLITDEGVVSIGLEVGGGHNVDDVVVRFRSGPPLYHQVKFVTDQREPLSHEWFTTVPRGAQRSPLQRFYDSYTTLALDDERPHMVLVTNRLPVNNDPILKHIDGRTHKLLPRLREPGARSASGKARTGWADHLGIREDDLRDMLEHLEIRAGRSSLEEMRENGRWLMGFAGLQHDVNAVDVGMGEMRRLVRDGIRELDHALLREIIAEKRLAAEGKRATLLIQQIDYDPWPELATASVDWVERFEGAAPAARRQLRDPEAWNRELQPELANAVDRLRQLDVRDVLVAGKMRLAVGFLAGFELSDVAGFSVSVQQRDEDWSSSGDRADVPVVSEAIEIGAGDDIAIGASIAADLADDVRTYIEREGLAIGQLVVIRPESGVGRTAVGGPADARGLASAILDEARAQVRAANGPVLHLFQAAPLGVAVLLGHTWNRMPETIVYEDMGAGRGYAPTFRIPG
jgi:SMODS-associated and fused to various effectors sensor domain